MVQGALAQASQSFRVSGFRVSGCRAEGLLGGSWVDLSGIISRVTIVTTQIRGLITLFT